MKKFLPLLFLLVFLAIPQNAHAGLSEGCFPIVECDPGQDYYGGSCQAHVETVSGAAPSCESLFGPPAANKSWAFSCDAGCYQKGGGGGNVNQCPGGVMVPDSNGTCLITLEVVDDADDPDALGGSNPAYKVWDGTDLTEIVHVANAGCADDQIAVADANEPSGWVCANTSTLMEAVIQGIIDTLDTMIEDLGVSDATRNDIIGALNDMLTNTDIAAASTTLANALLNYTAPGSTWLGVTGSSYDGDQGGYDTADGYCESAYGNDPAAHVCTVQEILALREAGELPGSIGGDEKAWINGGPPGFNSASNDCAGWQTAQTTADNAWGRYWWFGLDQGWADGCNITHRYACCK